MFCCSPSFPLYPGGAEHGRPLRHTAAARAAEQSGLRPGPGGLFCGLLLVYQYVLPVFLVYGSLVSLIILLIWLYLCGQILFIGIVFTSVWYKHWRRRRLTDPDD